MDIRRVTLPRSSSPHIENQSKNSSRPVSFYDNFKGNSQSLDRNGQNRLSREIRFDRDKSPTQAHCLNTTVPQNITALNIAGRHTPTRSSLRHSRMIVMTKTGTGKLFKQKRFGSMIIYLIFPCRFFHSSNQCGNKIPFSF